MPIQRGLNSDRSLACQASRNIMAKEEKIKICKLAKKEYLRSNLKEYSKLVKDPCCVCMKCGHVAKDKKYLCKPVELN